MSGLITHAAFAVACLSIFFTLFVDACTGIKLTTKDGMAVHGRTLEFGLPVAVTTVVIPRKYAFQTTTSLGTGMVYTSKYAAVGAIAFDSVAILDGMNEKGLCVGTFYFPSYAEYVPTTLENQSKSLSPIDFPNWVLTQFANLEEVKAALGGVVIAPTLVKGWGNIPAPFHYIVFEKGGDAIVIEPMDGKLIVHPNPLGVLTNSPSFDWHWDNLRNFLHLSPYNVVEKTVAGKKIVPFGQGSGMIGLPGDFTPPSRFVRAALFIAAATPVDHTKNAVWQAFHILNNFDIPKGVAREKSDSHYMSDFTQLTCVRDPNDLKYYFKSYDDQTVKVIDLKKFNFDAKEVKQWAVTGEGEFVDVTRLVK